MTTTETPVLLTVAETAELLRVSRPTVYRRIAEGHVPAVRVGPGRAPLRIVRHELLARLLSGEDMGGHPNLNERDAWDE